MCISQQRQSSASARLIRSVAGFLQERRSKPNFSYITYPRIISLVSSIDGSEFGSSRRRSLCMVSLSANEKTALEKLGDARYSGMILVDGAILSHRVNQARNRLSRGDGLAVEYIRFHSRNSLT